MKRGDLITVALAGDYGKPRPALIVQGDEFDDIESVTVLLLTSSDTGARRLRVSVKPDERNGLRNDSFVMIDKVMTLPRERAGRVIGQLDERTMAIVSSDLARFLGFHYVT